MSARADLTSKGIEIHLSRDVQPVAYVDVMTSIGQYVVILIGDSAIYPPGFGSECAAYVRRLGRQLITAADQIDHPRQPEAQS